MPPDRAAVLVGVSVPAPEGWQQPAAAVPPARSLRAPAKIAQSAGGLRREADRAQLACLAFPERYRARPPVIDRRKHDVIYAESCFDRKNADIAISFRQPYEDCRDRLIADPCVTGQLLPPA